MQHTQQIDTIRRLVRNTFAELNVEQHDLRETILIRDGHYCGRRFHAAPFQAIWFIEEDQVKFYGEDGGVLKSLAVQLHEENLVAHRNAA